MAPSVKCSIIGKNLKILSKSVRLMSKFSDHVNISANKDSLIFQSVNDSRSAFCEVLFHKEFCNIYEYNYDFECKVDIKSLGLVFKVINMDRINEICKITMDSSADQIIFVMKAKFDVSREYAIPYIEGHVIRCQSVSKKQPTPTLKADAKFLFEMLKHFPKSTIEVTLWLFHDHLSFKTFIQNDSENFFDIPCTSFSLCPNSFQTYNYRNDILTTFSVRDVKAYLDFAVHNNQLINIYLQAAGEPLELTFNHSDDYSSRITLASILLEESEIPEPPVFKSKNRSYGRGSLSASLNKSPTQSSLVCPSSSQSDINQTTDSSLVLPTRDNSTDDVQQPNMEDIVSDTINRQSPAPEKSNTPPSKPEGEKDEPIYSDDSDEEQNMAADQSNILDIIHNLPNFIQDNTKTEEVQRMKKFLGYHDTSQLDRTKNLIEIDSD